MKNFKQFNEAANAKQKQAALRARQQAAVAKYKSSASETKTEKPKQESEVPVDGSVQTCCFTGKPLRRLGNGQSK